MLQGVRDMVRVCVPGLVGVCFFLVWLARVMVRVVDTPWDLSTLRLFHALVRTFGSKFVNH